MPGLCPNLVNRDSKRHPIDPTERIADFAGMGDGASKRLGHSVFGHRRPPSGKGNERTPELVGLVAK
jgi:hypothetical protein